MAWTSTWAASKLTLINTHEHCGDRQHQPRFLAWSGFFGGEREAYQSLQVYCLSTELFPPCSFFFFFFFSVISKSDASKCLNLRGSNPSPVYFSVGFVTHFKAETVDHNRQLSNSWMKGMFSPCPR